MRNLTITLPDEVYRRARVRAAEADTSVSALVASYLGSLGDDDAEYARLAELQQRTLAEIQAFRASDRVSREEVHDRALR